MSNQFLKLRRSSVPGKVPTTSSLEFGEIALNTYDGLAFIKKSGSSGEEIITIGATSGNFTGSLFGTASWALQALTSSYSLNIDGEQYYVAIFDGNNSVTSSLIYQSQSFTGIRATTPTDPTNPDILFVDGTGIDTYNLISAHADRNNYVQTNVQNFNNSTIASSDVVATADNGTESTNYIDMGINSSGYDISVGVVGGANDAYLYSTGNDLLIGNATPNKKVIIFNGGLDTQTNARVYVHEQGTVGINTSTYNSLFPPALEVQAVNSTTTKIINASANVDDFVENTIVNANAGTSASADFVAYNDLDPGNQEAGYINLGINSTNYVSTVDFPGAAGDAYVFTDSNHLILGPMSQSAESRVTIFAGGISEIDNAKLVLYGNNRHQMTGSLNASQGFTGSLFGTASWARNALTASFVPSTAIVGDISRIATGSVTASVGIGTASFQLTSGSSTFLFVSNSGGVGIGTTSVTDVLTVSGSTLLRGAGNTSATNALTIRNSDAVDSIKFRNDTSTQFGSSTNGALIFPSDVNGLVTGSGENLTFSTSVTNQNYGFGAFHFRGGALTTTSGNNTMLSIARSFSPSSGNANMYYFVIGPLINQTGGSNGITRGIFVAPTLTSASDWRSIEWSNNTGWGLYGAGTANNYFAGSLGIGSTSLTARNLVITKALTGSTTAISINNTPTAQSDVTDDLYVYNGAGSTAAAAFSLTNLSVYRAAGGSVGVGSSIGNQYGFQVASSFTQGTNNYGFIGAIPAGSNRWNLYMNGTALNYLNGSLLIGTTTDSGFKLDVNGSGRFTNGLQVTGSLDAPVITGSLFGTASWARNALTASSADNFVIRQDITASNALFTGTVTAQRLVVQTITSSVDFVTGSTRFGSLLTDTHQFTGSVSVTGSLSVNGGAVPLGSGTAGQVTVWSAASQLSGSNNLFWDSTNGRLGVGTSSPANILDVRNSTSSYVANIQNTRDAGSTEHGLRISLQNGGGNANFIQGWLTQGGGSERFRIRADGAIFTTSSITVLAGGGATNTIVGTGVAGTINNVNSIYWNNDSDGYIGSPADGTFVVATNGIQRLRITPTLIEMTGSLNVSGSSHSVIGPTTINNLTGSLFGTASWALNALTASFVPSTAIVGDISRIATGSVTASVSTGNDIFKITSGSLTYLHVSGNVNIYGNTSNQGVFSTTHIFYGLGASQGGKLQIRSAPTTVITDSPALAFVSASGAELGLIYGDNNRIVIGARQPSTSITSTGYFYAAANRAATQFGLTTNTADLSDNTVAVFRAHWTGGSALELKAFSSSSTANTFRVRNISDTSNDFSVNFTGNTIIGTSVDTGYKLYVSGSGISGSLNVDNLLYASSSAVGIGLSNPSARLHISGSTGILLEVDSNTQNNILYVTSSGNVGIGWATTGSLYRLDISGSTRVTDQLYIESASIDYQQNLSVQTGSWQNIVAAATGSYKAAFFDYVMFSGSIGRAGIVTTFWSASATEFYENYTEDLGGSTAGVVLQTAISSSQIVLQATASSAAWTIRSLVRLL